MPVLTLTGAGLSADDLAQAARGDLQIALCPDGLTRMAKSRALVDQVIADGMPVYGVTTGLGARSTEALDAETLQAFSVQTLRGRAQALGPPEAPEVLRAAMIVRANTMLSGCSGAHPRVAEHLVTCLNAGLTPIVGQLGSIGAADLVINATLGLSLIGEGRMQDRTGQVGDSEEMMQAHGIAPLQLGPRDGLALANHTGYVAGAGALVIRAADRAFEALQTASALSMEAFRANLTPLDPGILAVKPLPGQAIAATGLTTRLRGSALWDSAHARRMQDPLSIRNVAQIHGTLAQALSVAEDLIEIEINGVSDNPVALVDEARMISGGNYYSAELCHVIEGVSRAFVPVAMAQLARFSKLLTPAFSDLPAFLAQEHSASNGFAPVMKPAEALAASLTQAAQPVPVWPSINANGIEDCLPNTPVAIRGLETVVECSRHLTAIELLVAARGIELRGCQADIAPFLGAALVELRRIAPAMTVDRSVSADIGKLAAEIAQGENRAFFPG
ncbi:aromatic amino acid lyase [Ruegeria sp.]|uniref:aromatic amino acid lyase n=1 Tax=Ruegeria sp. TaxID=1879320 RepID=UPI003B5CA4EB